MWVKICGISNMKSALAAYEAGADAVGFVFAPSRRQVTPDRAQSLIMGIPADIDRVGVFVDESPAEMARIARHAGLTHIQMHGDEPPEALDQVGGIPVIKAFRIRSAADLERLPAYRAAAGLLLDPYVEGQHGGTGKTLDWSLFRQAEQVLRAAGVPLGTPDEKLTTGKPLLILAGGLTPESVAEAIRHTGPGGVDVSSGVETDGVKDIEKVYIFIENAKEVSA